VPARVGWNEDRMTVAGRGKAQEQGGGAHLSIGLTDGYRLDFEKIISINIYRYVRELAWGSMIEAKNVMVAMDDGPMVEELRRCHLEENKTATT
jgi:hypothetical protein